MSHSSKMAFIQWRRFDFFVHNYLDKKPDEKTKSHKLLIGDQESVENLDTFEKLKKIKITCSDSGRGLIVLGDQNGWVHRLDNNFAMVMRVDESKQNVIKIWNQDRIDPHKQMPTCIRLIKNSLVMHPTANSKITCLKATDTLTFMCIGYSDGNLVTIRGDILKENSCKHKRIALCKEAITGVFLKGNYQNVGSNFFSNRLLSLNLKQQTKHVTSFITTISQVYFFEMKNDQENWNLIENDFGCATGRYCCLINDGKHLDNCLFILGQKDAIYFYQNDGRGPCLPFDNEKLIMHWFKGYLIVVSKEDLPSTTKFTDVRLGGEKNQLTIYDIRNKYTAFSSTFSSVNQIFAEWGYIFVLLDNGRLVQIREKDMNGKLELLFKKQQYSLAIELAKTQNFNSDNLTDIFKEYADHLYKQGDFEGAINQYIKTIGNLEPSYVIKRYLDGQKVKNLTSYLHHLHKEGLANKDHTSLYLNCLTKLNNTSNLISFLQSFDNKQLKDSKEVKSQFLDVQNAISVLRKSQLYDQALYLSEQFKCYDHYFKIQIEDKGNYSGAIKFIRTKLLNEKDLFFNQYFVKYSKVLFREKPEETTQLFKLICELVIATGSSDEEKQKVFFYIDIMMSKPEKLFEFLEFLQEKYPNFKERTISNTLIEFYLQNYRATDDLLIRKQLEDKILRLLKDENYDDERVMILCQCIESRNDDQIIKICEKYGNRDHDLWVKAFLYFCKFNSAGNAKRENYLLKTILEITKRKLLPLVSITNLLSTNETINLQMVKNHLVNALAEENKIITEHESYIKRYKDETDSFRKKIERVEQNGKIFQSSKCSICNNILELPVVHFFCSHSFHLRCHESHCGENDNECCLCLPEQNRILRSTDLSQTINKNVLKDKFIESINKSDSDSYAIVASYFSKNLLN